MEKRDKNIKFRVSETEKKGIEKRAKTQDLKVSDYSRNMLLNGAILLLEKEEVFNLKQLGNNMNQLARHANYSNNFNAPKVLEEYQHLRILLNKVLEKIQIKK